MRNRQESSGEKQYEKSAVDDWMAWPKSESRIECLKCQGKRPARLTEKVFCYGDCNAQLPEFHFVESKLLEWRRSCLLSKARCARCFVRSNHDINTLELP